MNPSAPNQQLSPTPGSYPNPATGQATIPTTGNSQVVNPNQAPTPGIVPPQPAKPAATNPNSTQNALEIAEVRDGIIIMNDGSFRSVVMVKSINFDLILSNWSFRGTGSCFQHSSSLFLQAFV